MRVFSRMCGLSFSIAGWDSHVQTHTSAAGFTSEGCLGRVGLGCRAHSCHAQSRAGLCADVFPCLLGQSWAWGCWISRGCVFSLVRMGQTISRSCHTISYAFASSSKRHSQRMRLRKSSGVFSSSDSVIFIFIFGIWRGVVRRHPRAALIPGQTERGDLLGDAGRAQGARSPRPQRRGDGLALCRPSRVCVCLVVLLRGEALTVSVSSLPARSNSRSCWP